jgi:hypothetical protein
MGKLVMVGSSQWGWRRGRRPPRRGFTRSPVDVDSELRQTVHVRAFRKLDLDQRPRNEVAGDGLVVGFDKALFRVLALAGLHDIKGHLRAPDMAGTIIPPALGWEPGSQGLPERGDRLRRRDMSLGEAAPLIGEMRGREHPLKRHARLSLGGGEPRLEGRRYGVAHRFPSSSHRWPASRASPRFV